ncbi:MAG: hypothetical protein LBD98_01225 [Endomicrobium sp.]|jgi:uncharacterized membrane-anchored protein YhcB (DUF1043 family)|nr:hypothetical protein [Endomicrobium sp.]
MGKSKQSKYHECRYSEKTWFLVIVGTAIAVSLLTVIAVAYVGHKSFNNALMMVVSKTASISLPQNSSNTIKITDKNSFVEHITGFYETVITIFSIMIGLVLVVGFIYLRNVSKSEVRKAVSEEIDTDFFKSYLKEQLENVFKSDTKDGILSDFINEQYQIRDDMQNEHKKMTTQINEQKETIIALQETVEKLSGNNEITQPDYSESKEGINGNNKKV